MTTDAQRAEAQARRAAALACQLCDEHGWITGHRTINGTRRDAAWRCTHNDDPLPTGFIPDHGDHR